MGHPGRRAVALLLLAWALGCGAGTAADWTSLSGGGPSAFPDRLELDDGGALLVGTSHPPGADPVPTLIRVDAAGESLVWEHSYPAAAGVQLRVAQRHGESFAVLGDGASGFHLGLVASDGHVESWTVFEAEGARASALTVLADGGLALAGTRTWAGGEAQDWYWLARLSPEGALLWQRQEQLVHSLPGPARAFDLVEAADGSLLFLGGVDDRNDESLKISQVLLFSAGGELKWGATLKSLLNGKDGLTCRAARELDGDEWLLACAVEHGGPWTGVPRSYLYLLVLGDAAGDLRRHVLVSGLSVQALAPGTEGGFEVLSIEDDTGRVSLVELDEHFNVRSAVASDWPAPCAAPDGADCRLTARLQGDGSLVVAGAASSSDGWRHEFPRFSPDGALPPGCFPAQPARVAFYPPAPQHWRIRRTVDRPPEPAPASATVAAAPPVWSRTVEPLCPEPTECGQPVAWVWWVPPGARCAESDIVLQADSTPPLETAYDWDVDHVVNAFAVDETGPTLRVPFNGEAERTVVLRARGDCERGEWQLTWISLRWAYCDRMDELSDVRVGEPPLRVWADGRLEVQALAEVDAVNLLVGRIGEWPSEGLATQTCHRTDGTYTLRGTLILDEELPPDSWVLAAGANGLGSGPWGLDSLGLVGREPGLAGCGPSP